MSSIRLVTTVDSKNPNLHDLQLDAAGQFVYIGFNEDTDESDHIDMIRQRIVTSLLLFEAEWYQDLRVGLPYLQRIFKKGTTDLQIKAIFRKAILAVPGMASISEIAIERVGRSATLSFSGRTDKGYLITVDDLDVPFIVSPEGYERT